MPSNDYTELRAWLERMGAQCAGTIGYMLGDGDQGAQFEAWVYGGHGFILGRERRLGVTTGAVTLYSMVGDKDSPVSDDILHLRIQFRQEDIKREKLKHRTSHEHACALPEAEVPDVHYCNMVRGHEDGHECKCGFRWSQVEGDNALLTHPADTKKKPERVRGFTI